MAPRLEVEERVISDSEEENAAATAAAAAPDSGSEGSSGEGDDGIDALGGSPSYRRRDDECSMSLGEQEALEAIALAKLALEPPPPRGIPAKREAGKAPGSPSEKNETGTGGDADTVTRKGKGAGGDCKGAASPGAFGTWLRKFSALVRAHPLSVLQRGGLFGDASRPRLTPLVAPSPPHHDSRRCWAAASHSRC